MIGSAELLIFTLGSLFISAFLIWLAAKVVKVDSATFGRGLVVTVLGFAVGLANALLSTHISVPPAVLIVLGVVISVALVWIVFKTSIGKAVATWLLAIIGHGLLVLIVTFVMLGVFGQMLKPISIVDDLSAFFGKKSSWHKEPVCTVVGSQKQPAIYEDRIVYEDHRGSDSDIYLYDLKTGKEKLVCGGKGNQTAPKIWGDSIVWVDDRNGTPTVWWLDLTSEKKRPLRPNGIQQGSPAIYGDMVVWKDYINEIDINIIKYNLETGAVDYYSGPGIDGAPCAGPHGIIFGYTDGDGRTLALADDSAPVNLREQLGTANYACPDVRGSAIAYEYGYVNSFTNIGIYDLDRQNTYHVQQVGRQRKPKLGKGCVVFIEDSTGVGIKWRLCRHDLETGKTEVIQEDCDESDSYDVWDKSVVYTEPEPGGMGYDIWISRPVQETTADSGRPSNSIKDWTKSLPARKEETKSSQVYVGEQEEGYQTGQLPYEGMITIRSSDLRRIKQESGMQRNRAWQSDSPLGFIAYLYLFYLDKDLSHVSMVPGWMQTTSELENHDNNPYRFAIEVTTLDDEEGRNLPYIETVLLQHVDTVVMSEAYAFYGFCTALEGPERIDRPYTGLTDDWSASPHFSTRVEVLDATFGSYKGEAYIDEIRLRIRIEQK